jgi:hemolysin-activating ACP:hemolysin acyltransferase
MALWSKKSKTEEVPAKPPVSPQKNAARPQVPTVAPSAAKELSAADMQKRAAASKQLLLKFGEVVSVLMQTPQFRSLPLAEVEALVVPPIKSGQFLVAEAQSKSQGFIVPVATALWAKVSKDVDRRLSENLDKPIKLAPGDWKSGEIAWLIVLAGKARMITPMLTQLQKTTLKGQPLKMRVQGKDGKKEVKTFTGQAEPVAS